MKFGLAEETLFLTVNLIDRYTARVAVKREKYQLLGVSAMWLASKYVEVHPAMVTDFTHITDDNYTRQQVITQELEILTALKIDLTIPTAYHFLERVI